DYDRRRLIIPSQKVTSKSKHREVLLEERLASILKEAQPESTSEFVVNLARSNIEQRMYRIVDEAKLQRWEKPFHTLRKWRATSWRARYPEHVVDAWLGHSLKVAREHYVAVEQSYYGDHSASVHQLAAQLAGLTPEQRQAIIDTVSKGQVGQ